MNESEFEQELRALQPHAPSLTLARRIAAEMPAAQALVVASSRTLSHAPAAGLVAQPHRSPWLGLLRGLLWATGGAAAAIVIMALQEPPQIVNGPASSTGEGERVTENVSEPRDESVSELISANDEGLIYDRNSAEPQRQMRLEYLERHVWTNPQTGAVIEFEVPREDIVLMPVAMQ